MKIVLTTQIRQRSPGNPGPSFENSWSELCVLSHWVVQLFATPWITASQAAGSFVHGDSPGKNTGVGSHSLLQGLAWSSNQGIEHKFLALQADSLLSEPPGKPRLCQVSLKTAFPLSFSLCFLFLSLSSSLSYFTKHIISSKILLPLSSIYMWWKQGVHLE